MTRIDFIASIAIKIFGLIVSSGLVIVLTRKLLPEEYGSYFFAISVLTMIVILVKFGLPNLLIREISKSDESAESDSKGKIKGILLFAIGLVIILVSISTFVFGSSLYFLYKYFYFYGIELLALALVLLPLVAISDIFSACMRALQLIRIGQFFEGIFRNLLLFIFVIVVIAFVSRGVSGAEVMLLHITAALISCVVGLFIVRKALPFDWRTASPKYEAKIWLGSAFPLAIVDGAQIILSKIDIVLLRFLSGAESVAIYGLALQLVLIVNIALQAVVLVNGPRLARLHQRKDFDGMQRILTISSLYIFLACIPGAVIILFFGKPLVGWIVGDFYVASIPATLILTGGYLFMSLFGSVEILLKMTGHEKVILHSVFFGFLANIGLNLLLIPKYGNVGAAISTAVILSLWRAYLSWKAYQLLGLVTLPFAIKR